jgi:hypothetical protein
MISAVAGIPMHRVWAMASAETFTITPIGQLVKKYLHLSRVSVDPFSRNTRWATFTNDLNPATQADSHLPAVDFLANLVKADVKADLVLFDPPYSLRQVKECYEGFGRGFTQSDAQSVWRDEKDLCAELLTDDGIFIHCGWHSNGLGLKRGFDVKEVLLVAHGRVHNDTIITVERRQRDDQLSLI